MGGYDVPGMDQPVQRTRALGEMGVVGIVRTDPVQNEIEAIGKVGHARPQTVQVEPILDVRSLDLAKHLVSLEAAEPLDPGLVVAGRRGILVVGHIILFIETTNAAKLSSATRLMIRLPVCQSNSKRCRSPLGPGGVSGQSAKNPIGTARTLCAGKVSTRAIPTPKRYVDTASITKGVSRRGSSWFGTLGQ